MIAVAWIASVGYATETQTPMEKAEALREEKQRLADEAHRRQVEASYERGRLDGELFRAEAEAFKQELAEERGCIDRQYYARESWRSSSRNSPRSIYDWLKADCDAYHLTTTFVEPEEANWENPNATCLLIEIVPELSGKEDRDDYPSVEQVREAGQDLDDWEFRELPNGQSYLIHASHKCWNP